MCLTIPGKVVKIEKGVAIIQNNQVTKKIAMHLVPDLCVGDWILYVSDFAIKKISANEAGEIINLLESPTNDFQELSSNKISSLLQKSQTQKLTKKEIIELLQTTGANQQNLFNFANAVRQKHLKDFICIHGIIEFSNFCRQDCAYCGLNKNNTQIPRYRMTPAQIIKTACEAVNKKGYKLLVLQSGEDPYYTDKILCDIIKKIKNRAQVFIFLSLGERNYASYKKLKLAGASGVLFRFETSNKNLFKKLHPRGKSLQNRFEHLRFFKKLGYFVATGSLIGLQGQRPDDLATDLLTAKKYAHMVSMGPFAPCQNTQMFTHRPGDIDLSLKMIAVARLLTKTARIPVVTALETLAGENIRSQALLSGANSLMFNLTPKKFRQNFNIYNNKFYQKNSLWQKYGLFKNSESYDMLKKEIEKDLSISN